MTSTKTTPKSLLWVYVLFEMLFLFTLGGAIYYGIEILYRGYSHVTMFFVGGLCFLLIGNINELIGWDMALWKQVLIGDFIVLCVEFAAGVWINLVLHLNVWDYSDLPFNLLGQICLPFAILWLPIVLLAIVVDDWVRYLLFGEEKPHYKLK